MHYLYIVIGPDGLYPLLTNDRWVELVRAQPGAMRLLATSSEVLSARAFDAMVALLRAM